jgi:hypothetical protein
VVTYYPIEPTNHAVNDRAEQHCCCSCIIHLLKVDSPVKTRGVAVLVIRWHLTSR